VTIDNPADNLAQGVVRNSFIEGRGVMIEIADSTPVEMKRDVRIKMLIFLIEHHL
jgi:hypothetical protein